MSFRCELVNAGALSAACIKQCAPVRRWKRELQITFGILRRLLNSSIQRDLMPTLHKFIFSSCWIRFVDNQQSPLEKILEGFR
jgi:hypothetical protein